MTTSENFNRLWGGRLEATWLDPCGDRVELVIAVASGDDVQRFSVEAQSIREFRFASEGHGRPWFYAEVTEVSVQEVADDMHRLVLILWSEDDVIEVVARSIEVRLLNV
jgi:hypothetical protein